VLRVVAVEVAVAFEIVVKDGTVAFAAFAGFAGYWIG